MGAHHLLSRLAAPIVLLVSALAPIHPARVLAGEGSTVRFRDREIDLRPFVEGFPYKSFTPDYDSGRFFYFKEDGETSTLHSTPLPESGPIDLSAGKPVLSEPVNWTGRSFGGMEHHPETSSMVLMGDERNDEVWNLFRLCLETGALDKVTAKPYVYGFGLDKARKRVAYIPRYGEGEPYRSCLNLLDWETGREEEIACDTPEVPLTWARVSFRPDSSGPDSGGPHSSGVVIETNLGGDRRRNNLLWLDFSKKRFELLTDGSKLRNTATVMEDWVDAGRFLYLSDESGYTNLYLYDLESRASREVTAFREDLSSWAPLSLGGRAHALLVIKRPHESEVQVVDPSSGKEVYREVLPDQVAILDHREERVYVQRSSVKTHLRVEEWRFARLPGAGAASSGRLGRTGEVRVEPPAELSRRIDQVEVERVEIPTFDLDPATGKTRRLHAYLYTPRNPPARPEQRFAVITAFYGGENAFDMSARIIGAAGGISLSPAVRGSWGFGREFFSLNDRDLGGNEIVDVIHAGRYLARRFGLEESQIGPWGGSHGGYATMRLLTFPRMVNGREEAFDWGFGMAHAGFSSILSFYQSCNIPDWVKLEAGDPAAEAEKLRDRSPLSHLELLRSPVLLTHGENDRRVPVRESRQFAEKARELGRPVTYVEFPGQGHGLKGIPNQRRLWQARFSFLEKALAGGLAAAFAGGNGGGIGARTAELPSVPLPEGAERAAQAITAPALEAPIRYLADDFLEGRGPATRGDRLTRLYLSTGLQALGLEPAAPGGKWEQPFDIIGIDSQVPPEWSFRSREGEATFKRREDFIAASGVQSETASIKDAEVVFAGYGIEAPEHGWDDFKGADLRGKVLVLLNNDPDWDPKLFEGNRRLYYGRWTYKYESAARRGAAGAIIIHTTPSAGYPWQVVQSSWSGEQFELPAEGEPRVQVAAWMTEEAARKLFRSAGRDLEKLVESARSRDFRPVPLGATTSLTLRNKLTRVTTANVLGLLPGSDPRLKEEAVVFTAHHDHLGIGEPDATGDRIHNGALDNASGVSQVLAIARAFRALPRPPRRSILFLFVAAEEQGLLGSEYYATHPTFHPGRIAANINYDGANIWGRSRDVSLIGYGKSSLDRIAEALAAKQDRIVKGDQFPDRGFYYRSDQFNFAKIGVPALYFDAGTDFRGRPEGWGKAEIEAWEAKRYHQPSDQIDETWNFDGIIEDTRLGFEAGLAIAENDALPAWVPGDEFEAARKKALAEARRD